MEIRAATTVDEVLAPGSLYDHPPRAEWAQRLLARDDHHLLLAWVDGAAVGFVSGVELTHPDKGTEMFLYELAVDEDHRRRGIGRALVDALAERARTRDCYDMWVLTDRANTAAMATYQGSGASDDEDTVMLTWPFAGRW